MPWEKQFDVDVALRRAGETFWLHGYEATSMSNLLDAMGIQKGSFYDTYGSKRKVYLLSLDQRVKTGFAELERLTLNKKPRQALKALLKAVFDDCVNDEKRRGCMLVNCALELAHDDEDAQRIVKNAFARHEGLFAEQIIAGQASEEFSPEVDPIGTSKAMLALVMGMRVITRLGASKANLKVLFNQALALVEH